MIDDLQRGAQRIVRRPGVAALAVHVEHEAADRHRRIAAISDQILPVAIAALGDVHAKRREQILSVAWRKRALGERVAQRGRVRLGLVFAQQPLFELVEQRELVRFGERGMVRDVVGGAHEAVERENQSAVTASDQAGSHREVLVPMGLAGLDFRGGPRHNCL